LGHRNAVQQLAAENERLKTDSAILKARADKAEADIRAKDAAIRQLKAAFCSKFSDLPICASNLAE